MDGGVISAMLLFVLGAAARQMTVVTSTIQGILQSLRQLQIFANGTKEAID
jgi:hypothetical protein